MGWTEFRKTIHVEIKIDIEELSYMIAKVLEDDLAHAFEDLSLELDDADGSEFVYKGTYETDGRAWYSPATMWSPEEYEVERNTLIGCEEEIKSALRNHAYEIIDTLGVSINEE